MTGQCVYEIGRYGVSTDEEILVERARLLSDNGELKLIIGDGRATACGSDDVAAVIGADPRLNEIRANQITRISASPEALNSLPFVLQVPGHIDDYDESLWSPLLADQHLDQEWEILTGLYRVVYVNGDRWCPWHTADGDPVLPGDWPTVRLEPLWALVSFREWGSRTSGIATFSIGLATPAAVVSVLQLDELDRPDVQVSRRGDSAVDDAAQVMHWLLDEGHFSDPGDPMEELIAQLFVEATLAEQNGVSLPGSRLAAGSTAEFGFGDSDSAEWMLALSMTPEMEDAALDILAARGPRLREIITAGREPESPAGQARKAALDAWSAAFTPQPWQQYS